jgi:hypothetical protein
MLISEWIGLVALIGTNAGISIGIYKYFDGRISRVYERFDEHKKNVEESFVKKDLCKIMHDNSAANITGLENRLTIQVKDLKKQVEDNFAVVIGLMKK